MRADRVPGLEYRFRDPELLRRALTHRSCGGWHNERLEFLGDGLLNFVVAEMLYRDHPDLPEGDLTRMRARIVRDTTLAEIARELGLGDSLRLGSGELKSGGFLRASILADAVEAIIGAVYLDSDFVTARDFVRDLVGERVAALPDAEALKDAKTRLQEFMQARGLALPEYELVSESGADHDKYFRIACRVSLLDEPVIAGAGGRRKAEQAAARKVLDRLGARPDHD